MLTAERTQTVKIMKNDPEDFETEPVILAVEPGSG
jgi:hypothetical protein